jgi:uncharacterized protein YukE
MLGSERRPRQVPSLEEVGRDAASLARDAEKPGLGTGISLTLNVITLAVAVGMAVILVFISNTVREVAVLEDRLAGLTQFEKRLSGQVDTVNQGFHSQFDEMNRRLSAMADHMARLQRELETVSARARSMDERLQALDAAAGETAAIGADRATSPDGGEVVLSAPPPALSVQPPAPADGPAAPEPSAQFERIISPDGKVTYSKRR